MRHLISWVVKGFGWEVGKEAAKAAIDEVKERVDSDVDERRAAREAEKAAKAEQKPRAEEKKRREREARDTERQVERELESLKKRVGQD